MLVDLPAREKEYVDAALSGAIEQLPPSIGEERVPPAAKEGDVGLAAAACTREQRGRRRNR